MIILELIDSVQLTLQEITRSSFKVCVKDTQGISRDHDPITVQYAVVGSNRVVFS